MRENGRSHVKSAFPVRPWVNCRSNLHGVAADSRALGRENQFTYALYSWQHGGAWNISSKTLDQDKLYEGIHKNQSVCLCACGETGHRQP